MNQTRPNYNLLNAQKSHADEFYTRYEDAEEELTFYKERFRDKTIYCNCDSLESNIFQFFLRNFRKFKLKKLIATSYSPDKPAYKTEVTDVPEGMSDNFLTVEENTLKQLNGNGDFRSEECRNILREADIVVTNPPFSLFGEFVSLLNEYRKKFIVMGTINAITYKNTFAMLMRKELRLGYNPHDGNKYFSVPDSYPLHAEKCFVRGGVKYIKVSGIRWFTNFDVQNPKPLQCAETYSPDVYPSYDQYDAINVDRVKKIPRNYSGKMGVPITFLDYFNPNEFDLLGRSKGFSVNGKQKYVRLIIQRKAFV